MNGRYAWLGMIVSIAGLAGCATKQFQGTPNSASELTVALAVHYSGLIDRPFVATSTPPDASGEFRVVQRYWCDPNGPSSTVVPTKAEYAALCSRLGGSFQGDFCVKSSATEEVLFMAQVVAARQTCVNGAAVRVVEPTRSTSSAAYLGQLQALGYRTPKDRAAQQALAEAAASRRQREALTEAERRVAAYPRMRQRGTRVCLVDGSQTTVGFVEDSTDTKLQIRVVTSYMTRLPQVKVGGPYPYVTWDVGLRWEMCEGA